MSKKEDKSEPNITYSIDENTTTDTWAPASEQFTVSYTNDGITPSGAGVGTVDTMDISDMMRQDAGKGMENFTFDDYNLRKPFENSVPSLEKIDELCAEYPALKIAYDKFRNVWRICYNDYVSKNPDEENY